MRIAVVTESFLPQVNGVTNSVLRVLEHLHAEGHQALVVAPGSRARPAAGERTPREHCGFPVVGMPSVPLPRYQQVRVAASGPLRLDRTLAAFRPDVMHLAAPFLLGQQAAQAGHRLGIPMVSVYQTEVPGYAARYGLPQLEPVLWRWVRHVHNLTGRTLAPSSFAAAQLAEHGVQRVHRWGRGVDTARFHRRRHDPAWRARVAPPGTRIVLFVGRLAAEKQVEDLRVLSDLPATQVVVIGDGPKRAELQRTLPDAVFLGQQTGDAVPVAMASADLFVHTGPYETFCQSIQESLASGTPVVAPARGGPVDLVDHSRTGWLYEPGDLTGLRARVRDLLGDDAKRDAFGVAARRSVLGRSWPAVCAELVNHYRSVIAADHQRIVRGKNSSISSL